ncbi:hypothetical protein mvi_686 [Megavirus vitis]|uniref:Uncharacterized protein n=1 Tax=Megavirus lba TaxID=1235314 RepID=L7Y4L0_9VIRU|nr:hypothetical protein LBA_00761 [Megavirus lba]AVL94046.1 hypothetical protein mvi_686 [Megavirus vitis]
MAPNITSNITPNVTSNIAVTLIKTIHILIIIGVISSIFISNCMIKQLALTLLIFLLLQYLLGFEKCGLTQLEYALLGQKYQQGFIYRVVNPIICVPEGYFNNGFMVVHIVLIIILLYQIYSCFRN